MITSANYPLIPQQFSDELVSLRQTKQEQRTLSPLRNFDRLQTLQERFNQELIGQPQAVASVHQLLNRIVTGFVDVNRPFAVLLFVGPTGVGKTKLAKMIAEELDVPFHRYDMSEFSQAHTVARLIGSPPGYINSNHGGQLINDLTKDPVSVVLFDEIEKAHPNIYPIFLQLFDEGIITNSMGVKADAKHVIFILTTNLGNHEINYNLQSDSPSSLSEDLRLLFKQFFSKELYNRFDQTIIFNPLNRELIASIAHGYMVELAKFVAKNKSVKMTWDPEVIEHIVHLQKDLEMGAREIQRQVKEIALNLLAQNYMRETFRDGNSVHFKMGVENKQRKVELIVLNQDDKNSSVLARPTIFVNSTGQFAESFIGKYVVRVAPCSKDTSFIKEPVKIEGVTERGEILYTYRVSGKLTSKWNDNKWMLVTPDINAKLFFLNVCVFIPNEATKLKCTDLVLEIFGDLSDKVSLSNEDPLSDLKTHCEQNALSQKNNVKKLERYLGRIKVVDLRKTDHYSTSHYDLKIPARL